MYKKIKNGSFMNWIWFIICILPIMLLFIYSLQFINNKTQGKRIDNIINYKKDYDIEESTGDEKVFFNTFLNTDYLVYPSLNDFNINDTYNILTFIKSMSGSTGVGDLLYFENTIDYDGYYLYFKLELDNGLIGNNYYFNYGLSNQINIDLDKIYKVNFNNKINFGIEGQQDVKISIYMFICKENINTNYFNLLENWNYIDLNNSYLNYLEDINNTLKTNGFISSAFLNLATLFGVNNVYYSLACYYIEYLLVIVLLHLAFDVLYMLPNICHKFMEKIGGERD